MVSSLNQWLVSCLLVSVPKTWGCLFPFQMAELHGLHMGGDPRVLIKWDDPPSVTLETSKVLFQAELPGFQRHLYLEKTSGKTIKICCVVFHMLSTKPQKHTNKQQTSSFEDNMIRIETMFQLDLLPKMHMCFALKFAQFLPNFSQIHY